MGKSNKSEKIDFSFCSHFFLTLSSHPPLSSFLAIPSPFSFSLLFSLFFLYTLGGEKNKKYKKKKKNEMVIIKQPLIFQVAMVANLAVVTAK